MFELPHPELPLLVQIGRLDVACERLKLRLIVCSALGLAMDKGEERWFFTNWLCLSASHRLLIFAAESGMVESLEHRTLS